MKFNSNYGVCVMANDRMIEWLLAFLHSYYDHHTDLPLYIIPYDHQLKLTSRAAKYIGAQMVDEKTLIPLDPWARRMYPWAWRKWKRLRKIASLMLPLNEVMYIDVDTLIFNDFSQLFGYVSQGLSDFLFTGPADGNHYLRANIQWINFG